jgi:PAS domain S-box-containing protein
MKSNAPEPKFYPKSETGTEMLPAQSHSTDETGDSRGQSLLQKVLRTGETGVWYWDITEGKIKWPNDVFPLSKTATDPFDYEEFLALVHPTDRPLVDQNWMGVLDGDCHEIDYRLSINDETRWLNQIVEVETAEDGAPQEAIGLLRDVTEQKEDHQDLQMFREIVEHSGHSVYWTDADGTIQYVNPAFEEITGYSYQEAVGKTPRILQSGEHDDLFFEELWETIRDGNVWSREIVNERKTGERYVINQTIAPIETDDGEIDSYVAVNSDITEQKEYERELEILREAIDKAPISITLTDPTREDNPISYVNEAFEELTGYPEAEVKGRNCRFLQGKETEIDRLVALQEAIDNEELFSLELRNYRKDGAMFWNRITITPIYDEEGNLVRYLGTQEDVTTRREHEQRLMVLNRVLRHNLRNKLSIITGFASALKNTCDDSAGRLSQGDVERVHSQIDSILETATELATLGNKVRRFQNVIEEANRIEPFQVEPVLDSAQSNIKNQFPEANIKVQAESDLSILANERAFKLTVEELLENAVVHNQSATPTARVRMCESDNDTVTVTIADTGPGIPEIEQKILTEGEESPLLHGSGFGLWIVNWLILRSGGSVTISDNEPTGTIVELRLPAAGKR